MAVSWAMLRLELILWALVLPFELVAAGITIEFWRDDINIGVWITVFLFVLCIIQIWGIRAYGEG
jgi:amino acid transporter